MTETQEAMEMFPAALQKFANSKGSNGRGAALDIPGEV
jgi:hypothetical protein